jgi:hypothetical protein
MARRDHILPIATRYEFTEKRRKGGHRVWVNAAGATVTTGSTLSDRRALLNIERDFRRAATGD